MKKVELSTKINILALVISLISILNVSSIFLVREIKRNSDNRYPRSIQAVLNEVNGTVEIYKDGKLEESIKIEDGVEISVGKYIRKEYY